MSVFRRKGSPFYKYEFQLNGRVYKGSTKRRNERDARAVEKEKRAEAESEHERATLEQLDPANSFLVDGMAGPATVGRVFERYWKTTGYKLGWAGAVKDHMIELERFLKPDTPFCGLGNAELSAALEDYGANTVFNLRAGKQREGKPVSDSTVNRRMAVFRQIYLKARDEWELPVKAIVFKKHKRAEPDERVRHITMKQARMLMARITEHPHIALMVAWSLVTGCRLDETETLTWPRVNLDTMQAEVLTKGQGKNKTRFVDLNPDALSVLAVCDQNREFVFDSTNRRKVWEAAVAAAGLEDFNWHDLRHTFATWFGNAVGDITLVQKQLGHTKVTTTMKYRHVIRADVKRALAQMPQLLRGSVVALKKPEPDED